MSAVVRVYRKRTPPEWNNPVRIQQFHNRSLMCFLRKHKPHSLYSGFDAKLGVVKIGLSIDPAAHIDQINLNQCASPKTNGLCHHPRRKGTCCCEIDNMVLSSFVEFPDWFHCQPVKFRLTNDNALGLRRRSGRDWFWSDRPVDLTRIAMPV